MSGLTPYEPMDLSKIDLTKIDLNKIQPEFKIQTPDYKNIPYRNPNEELENLAKEQNSELQKVIYENMKLNAQIEILNKTVDSQNEKFSELKNTNLELEFANKKLNELVKSQKHQILFGIFITIVGTVSADFIIRFLISIL